MGSINFTALAAAVINQTYDDALKENPPSEYRGKREGWKFIREEAQQFLTKPNSSLEFWCQIGGLNASAIMDASRKRFKEAGIQLGIN